MANRDLGLAAVERTYREMQIDAQWSVREPRGFTWWGSWVRQRVWAGEAVRSRGEHLWQVRARTPAYRDQPDEAATWAFVNDLNEAPLLSAWAYDPDEGTISARCGVLTYEGVDGWLGRYFRVAAALQSSVAWLAAPAQADGRALDDAPHPVAGPRRDPDDMLNLAGSFPGTPSPFTPAVLREVAGHLAADGAAVEVHEDSGGLRAALSVSADAAVFWTLLPLDHPLLGAGIVTQLFLPWRQGPVRAAWIANALNLAEASDWAGEDRTHALGAWSGRPDVACHAAFFPAVLFGGGADDARLSVDNLLAWATVRARFATERVPWLAAAAASRLPDDVPPDDGDADDDDGDGDGGDGHGGDAPAAGSGSATTLVRERSFGPASRTPRPPAAAPEPARLEGVTRNARADAARAPRELLVDPTDPAAFAEIDDAVAAADDGDRIRVRPGTYRRPVVVDRAVTIAGEGPVDRVRLEPVGGEALGVAASGARIEGLTIRPAEAGNDGAAWSAVAVHDVAVTVEGCHLSTHLGATVWVGGSSARAVLAGCTLGPGSQNAVWVAEEGRAEVAGCRVTGHRWPMAALGEHASLAVVDGEVVGNLDGGIIASKGAELAVTGTTVARNAGFGIVLDEASPASSVEDCTVEDNAAIGIVVEATRGARVLRNRVRGNEVGIVVFNGATPVVEGNVLERNRVGIGVRGEDSDPLVRANTVAASTDESVIVDEAAAGRFEGNQLSGGGSSGVWVDDAGTRPTFRGNHVSACKGAGILVTGGAGGDYRTNDLRGNADGSWHLHEPGEVTRDGNLEDTGIVRVKAEGEDGPMPPRLVN